MRNEISLEAVQGNRIVMGNREVLDVDDKWLNFGVISQLTRYESRASASTPASS